MVFLIVSRKPHDSRMILKRLTDEKKSFKYVIISMTCQSKKTYLEVIVNVKRKCTFSLALFVHFRLTFTRILM